MSRPRYVAQVTGTEPKHRLARMLARAIGPAMYAPDGSINAADLLAIGAQLATAEQQLDDAVAQSVPQTVTDLLDAWEDAFELPHRTELTTSERQARLTARVVAARVRGSAKGIERALYAINVSAYVVETTSAQANTAGDPRLVYQLAIVVPNAAAYTKFKQDILLIANIAKPAHCGVAVGVTFGFKTDDPNSLTDRDFVGT